MIAAITSKRDSAASRWSIDDMSESWTGGESRAQSDCSCSSFTSREANAFRLIFPSSATTERKSMSPLTPPNPAAPASRSTDPKSPASMRPVVNEQQVLLVAPQLEALTLHQSPISGCVLELVAHREHLHVHPLRARKYAFASSRFCRWS